MPEKDKGKQLRKKNRKQQIINCALKVFCDKGYDDAKIDDITKKAGCSHGLFYHYFNNKKELFDAVVTERNDTLRKNLYKKLEGVSSNKIKLKVIIEELYKELYRNENYARHFYLFVTHGFNRRNKKPPQGIKPEPPNEHPIKYVENLFLEGQKSGEFSSKYSPRECTKMFLSIIQGTTLAYVIAPKDMRKTMQLPKVEFILDIYLKGDQNG